MFKESKNLSNMLANLALSSTSGPPVSCSAFETGSLSTYKNNKKYINNFMFTIIIAMKFHVTWAARSSRIFENAVK